MGTAFLKLQQLTVVHCYSLVYQKRYMTVQLHSLPRIWVHGVPEEVYTSKVFYKKVCVRICLCVCVCVCVCARARKYLCDRRRTRSSFSNLFVTSPASQIILQPFRHFTYITVHSPTLPLLHLRQSSFSNPSFASPTSQANHPYLKHNSITNTLQQ